MHLLKAKIAKAKAMLEEGGDWERRNRLKVYEAVFLLQIRDFKASAALLLDSVATFTARAMATLTLTPTLTLTLTLTLALTLPSGCCTHAS